MEYPAVKMNQVEYCYGESKALANLSFCVAQGERIALVGENGSGKSTTARLINGLLLPTSGSVEVMGLNTADRENQRAIRQNVGVVFQNPDNQIVASIVEDDVAFGPENLGIAPMEIRKRVDEALLAVGCDGMQRRAPHNLSGGQKQRVAIASVLAMQPKILVFDESTSMLDPVGREEVLQIMGRLHRSGITVIHITHSMEEAQLAQRMLVLHRGSCIFDGPPHAIFAEHGRELMEMGIHPPFCMELAQKLNARGIDAGAGETMEGLVNALCPLK